MSRMKQLQALAKEAREKGDRDKYETIRGDIFREFDFDIGKFGLGGLLDKGRKFLEKKGVIDDLPTIYKKIRKAKESGNFKDFRKLKEKAIKKVSKNPPKFLQKFMDAVDKDLPLTKQQIKQAEKLLKVKTKKESKVLKLPVSKKQGGGEIKYDKGSQMDKYLKGLEKANKQMKKETAMAKQAFADQAKKIQKSKENLSKMVAQSKKNEKNIMLKNLEKALKSGKLSEKQILNRLAPPKIKAAKRVGNIALGLGTAAFAGAGYEIKKMFDRNRQLGARSKYGSSQDYPERPDTDKFGRKINKKNIGGEVRGKGKAIRGFKFGGIK